MSVKSFADTSQVALRFALDNAANSAEVTATEMVNVPFTTESFTLSLEPKQSTAIKGNRRVTGQKNTKGTAAGGMTCEVGYTPFVKTLLSAALMNDWQAEMDATDTPTGAEYITDGDLFKYALFEKRVQKKDKAGALHNYMYRYYGNLFNEATLDFSGAELVTLQTSTMALFADLADADASVDAQAGGLVTTYTDVPEYDLVDSSNSVEKIVLKDAAGVVMDDVTIANFSIAISNNVREQPAIGSQFAAGMGRGKVGVMVSGTAYYYDNTLLKQHIDNGRLQMEVHLQAKEGSYVIYLPKLGVGATGETADGENQDFDMDLSLTALEGEVELSGAPVSCAMAIVATPAP